MSYLALSKNHLIILNGIYKHNRSIFCSKWSTLRNFHHLAAEQRLVRSSSCCRRLSFQTCHHPVTHYYTNPNQVMVIRSFHLNGILYEKEPLKPSSKVEETVTKIKEELKEEASQVVAKPPAIKRSIKQRVIDECKHYYHGFRLLFIDLRISARLCTRLLLGKTLTRRENRLLVQTVSDLFRLIPFSVFIIVPGLELLLPVFIKLFPGMLPSTFQTATEKEDKLKQHLKMKLEMAKFWQKTLDDMAVQGTGRSSDNAKEFASFFQKIRDEKGETSNEEIKKFIKLFTDEITLDSLSRSQLVALCRLLEINTIGTTNFLLFQIRMKLRNLAADDKMIQSEGVDSLSVSELQQACKARGMRAYGMSNQALKSQLTNWLDLSLNEKVPPTLLLLSKALAIPDTVDPADQLKQTIATLPETIGLQTKAKIGESEGKIDHKTKIELIKLEETKIKAERLEAKAEEKRIKKEPSPEELVDKAPILSASKTPELEQPKTELTQKDFEAIEDALDVLGKEKKKLLVEKEELDDLKEELKDYKEDVEDLNTVLKTVNKEKRVLRESKAAKRLFNQVNSMIKKMDGALQDLEKKEIASKKSTEKEKEKEELVSIWEMREVLGKIQHVPDDRILDQITEVLQQMDDDKDGALRVDDVLKVIELVGHEHVKLDKKQIKEIIDLIDKEERIELEQQIAKKLNVSKTDEPSPKQATPPPPSKPSPPPSTSTSSKPPSSSSGGQCPPIPTNCSEDPTQKKKAAAVAAPPSIPKSNQPPPQAN